MVSQPVGKLVGEVFVMRQYTGWISGLGGCIDISLSGCCCWSSYLHIPSKTMRSSSSGPEIGDCVRTRTGKIIYCGCCGWTLEFSLSLSLSLQTDLVDTGAKCRAIGYLIEFRYVIFDSLTVSGFSWASDKEGDVQFICHLNIRFVVRNLSINCTLKSYTKFKAFNLNSLW